MILFSIKRKHDKCKAENTFVVIFLFAFYMYNTKYDCGNVLSGVLCIETGVSKKSNANSRYLMNLDSTYLLI